MAGVKKRVNPHNFRHSRETYLANFLTEAQMKEFFGWTQDSKMAGVYVHMSGRNVDNALLKIYGIKNDEEKRESIFKPKECPRCQKVNQATNKFCSRCGMRHDEQQPWKDAYDDDAVVTVWVNGDPYRWTLASTRGKER